MGDVSSGASQDIAQATSLARVMVLEWGMSPKLGFVRYAPVDTRDMFLPEKDYSENTARLVDEEVRRIVDEAYAEATRMIDSNWEKVSAVAEALLKYETLAADDVQKIMRGEEIAKPTVSDLLRAEARRRLESQPPAPTPDTKPDLPPGTLPTPA